MKFGNAPCSWGTLEFEETKGEQICYSQMLDELAETGYTGTELGDWGYMPTDPAALRNELNRRGLAMLGAFVPVALKNASSHDSGIEAAVRTARLLAAVATEPKPFLVLADNNGTDPDRTRLAGRIPSNLGLSPQEWTVFTKGANQIADAVVRETGLKTVFHHHCAGYVETPCEIARFLELTDPSKIGLVFDTGHFVYGAGHTRVTEALDQFGDRIWHMHFKDCDPSKAKGCDYFTALRHGVFCELGKGVVDFAAVLRWLEKRGYGGHVVVEQDILPGMGKPKESARRNLQYLRSLETIKI